MSRKRTVIAGSWSELPPTLEPGTYLIGQEKVTIREPVSRDALERTIKIMRKRGGKYI